MGKRIDEAKIDAVKSKISIPKYFEQVIIPELPSYYDDYTVNFESRPVVKCPIHGEDTPSLRWYEETNTFYCFGCRAGGDIINLHRLFMNNVNGTMPSFDESVDYLYNAFITGQDIGRPVQTVTQSVEPKSTNVEMIRLIDYLGNTEKMLQIDDTIKEKYQIYCLIDSINILCMLDLINASDGMAYIKEEIRRLENSNG